MARTRMVKPQSGRTEVVEPKDEVREGYVAPSIMAIKRIPRPTIFRASWLSEQLIQELRDTTKKDDALEITLGHRDDAQRVRTNLAHLAKKWGYKFRSQLVGPHTLRAWAEPPDEVNHPSRPE